ncbi:MAG TPA: replicative DNA helicase [Clostridia bacterium]|jgi:replicative DNA helicase|nr:replicative DNA helicase [Clostridia bacterium]
MDTMIDKIPPQNIEAEQSVLGAMLLEKDAIVRVMEILRPDDFYHEAHKIIFQSITDLFNQAEPVDLVTLTEELRRKGKLELVGGVTYITALANSVPTAANVDYYAKIVEEKSVLRKLIRAATDIVSNCYNSTEDVETIIDQAEQQIFKISQRRSSEGFAPIKSVLTQTFEKIEYLYSHKGGVTGIASGFSDLDKITSGFQPSDLIIVAARPSMGKTAFCLDIARNAAINQGETVAIFSLEMSKDQLAQRMLCAEARVEGQRLRTGFLTENDWPRLTYALGRLSEAPIFIDDTPGISIMEMRTKARRIKAEHGLGLLIIDYLQLMQSSSRIENRQQEISEISRSLKGLARELQVPIIALSQLSRAVESRQDKKPMLSDLRESGAIEQDADVVIFIYRDEYYNSIKEEDIISGKKEDNRGKAEIIIAKQRNGPVGSIELGFQKDFARFVSLEKERKEA